MIKSPFGPGPETRRTNRNRSRCEATSSCVVGRCISCQKATLDRAVTAATIAANGPSISNAVARFSTPQGTKRVHKRNLSNALHQRFPSVKVAELKCAVWLPRVAQAGEKSLPLASTESQSTHRPCTSTSATRRLSRSEATASDENLDNQSFSPCLLRCTPTKSTSPARRTIKTTNKT